MSTVDWDRLAETLARHPGVTAAWVFGSAQTGHVRPGSDLDVGVLFAWSPSLDELADLRADLQEALAVDAIDLVALNRASAILRFEAVSGRRVFCRDIAALAEFVSLTAREYEDAMAFARRGLAWYAERNSTAIGGGGSWQLTESNKEWLQR